MKRRKLKFYVSPVHNGWIAAFPSGNGQDFKVSAGLATQFPGDVLHVLVHDDDVFSYTLYRDHIAADQYSSIPDYFGEITPATRRQWQAHTERYAALLKSPDRLDELRRLLVHETPETLASDDGFAAIDRLERFRAILGLPPVVAAYEYLEDGETDDVPDFAEYAHVPDLAKRRSKEARARRAAEAELDRLRADRLLFACYSAPSTHLPRYAANVPHFPFQPRVVADPRAGAGLYVTWKCFGYLPDVVTEHIAPPYTALPSRPEFPFATDVREIAFDPAGRVTVIGGKQGQSASIHDLADGRYLFNLPYATEVHSIRFSPDQSRMLTVSLRSLLVITDLSDGHIIFRHENAGHQVAPAVRPDGEHVVVSFRDYFGVLDAATGAVVKRFALPMRLEPLPEVVDPRGLTASSVEDAIRMVQINRAMQATEYPTHIRFTADGDRLVVATTSGVHVFDFSALLKTGDLATPPPVAFVAAQFKPSRGSATLFSHVYCVLHDAASNLILFAGVQGDVRVLDTRSNTATTILVLPGRPGVTGLTLSADRRTLATVSQLDSKEIRRAHAVPWLLHLWNYEELLTRTNLSDVSLTIDN